MATITIRTGTYVDLPAVAMPDATTGEDVMFWDTTEANGTSADLRNGKKLFGASGEVTGTMSEKAAETYHPSTSDQTVAANQYLAGAQTIEAVTTTNLAAQNILSGVTVKVGSASDDDCVATVTGNLLVPVIYQDSVTKILHIS